jgi:ribulose-phosphate 3-epimerase
MPNMQNIKAKISASILSANFLQLEREILALDACDIDYFHLDIMDGTFVPQISFGAMIAKAIRPLTAKPFDTHLMVVKPQNHLETFVALGSQLITVHIEAVEDAPGILKQIQALGAKAGIAISPQTPFTAIQAVLEYVDLVLVMTVNPGLAGQKFIASELSKVTELVNFRQKHGLNFQISVDGGINAQTGQLAFTAGADILVSASYIFAGDYKANVAALSALKR